MPKEHTRREILAGAATVAAACVLTGTPAADIALPVPPRKGSYLWLVKIGGAPPFHGSAAELAELDWSIRDWPTVERALVLLATDPVDPDACDASMARALRCLVLKGHAEPTGDGRIRITRLGELDYEAERLESYG